MRGLLFTGGSRPDMSLATRFFGKYDAVYAADSGLLGAQEAGIEVNYVVGDMDSIPNLSVLENFDNKQIIRSPRDKDLTDTELALILMREQDISEIVLIGGDGGRMDHFFALYRMFSLKKPPIIWIGSDTIAFTLEAETNHESIVVTDLDCEAAVSIFPVGSAENNDLSHGHICVADGLYWPVNNLLWAGGQFSLSNRAPTGTCKIEAVAGRFLVVLPLIGGYSLS